MRITIRELQEEGCWVMFCELTGTPIDADVALDSVVTVPTAVEFELLGRPLNGRKEK